MKGLLFLGLFTLFLNSGINAEEHYYSNTWMGINYDLFINDKERLENDFIYKFRTRFESDSRKTINRWRIADCLESTIDGYLVPAIDRYGFERGMSALIKEICG